MASKFKTTLLLSSLNLILVFLSSASLVPIFVLRSSPTSYGWSIATVSAITLLSSLIGFYSQLTHFCFVTHVTMALASLIGLVLSFISLFLQHESARRLLRSQRDGKEVWVLMFLLELTLLSMALVQCIVLVLGCVAEKRRAREYEDVEAETDEAAKKRNRRVNAIVLDEKMGGEFGKWAKNDIEG